MPARPTDDRRSQLEAHVEGMLEAAGYATAYERITVHHRGRSYTPDFIGISEHGPRIIVEVKPNRSIAAAEVRTDLLVTDSPLWFIADLFIVAFDTFPWACQGVASVGWHNCTLKGELTIAPGPGDWVPADGS